MTLTQLHYMTAVAAHGNFTIAAEKCFVTQPTLSMQVQKLEDRWGKIFNRATKPIVLTVHAEKNLGSSQRITEEAIRMQDIVSTEKGVFIGGEFKLGIIPTVMPTLLPMFLNTFIKKLAESRP